MGDPAGIGPEVVLKAVAEAEVRAICRPVIIGDAQLLAHNARTLDLQCGYEIIRRDEPLPPDGSDPLIFHLNNIHGHVEPGIESGDAGRAAAEYIEAAVELCAAGSIDAIATAPINKRALFLGGYSFPGHTEFLAHLSSTEDYAMGFVAANLRVVLISTHVPLSEAIGLVRRERIEKTIRLADLELRRWGIERPRIAVAALNPHGAEGGLFGIEESSEILPAVEACKATDDINVSGPYSADTVFLRASRGEFDAGIACYRDGRKRQPRHLCVRLRLSFDQPVGWAESDSKLWLRCNVESHQRHRCAGAGDELRIRRVQPAGKDDLSGGDGGRRKTF